MKITKIKHGLAWAIMVTALGLVGCGGSSSKDGSPTPPVAGGGNNNGGDGGNNTGGDGDNNNGGDGDNGGADDVQLSTGIFVDGPVAGVSYTTSPGNRSGITNVRGEYDYAEGDKVSFRIGGIVFPEITAKGTVTPLDMGGEGATPASVQVVNILRLLQTLDEDGDPENGISITTGTAEKLAEVAITDFSESLDANSAAAIKTSTGLDLVDDIEAMEHFENSIKSLLAGSWLYVEEDGGRNLLTFLPDVGEYLISHDFHDGETQAAGTAEHGSYTWNIASGEIKVDLIAHSDAEGGFIEGSSRTMKLTINGDTLTLIVGEDGQAKFTAVKSSQSSLVGGWFLDEPEAENRNILTIFPDNHYVIAHTNNQDADGERVLAQSSEWGSYKKLDEARIEINAPVVETDGEGGLYNEDEESHTFDLVRAQANGDLEFVDAGEDESFAFRRLGAFPFTLSDGATERTVMLTRRAGSFQNEVNATYTLHFRDQDEQATLTLAASGSGNLAMSDGERPVTEWQVNSAGTLIFKEQFIDEEEATEWRISPVAGKSGKTVLVEIGKAGADTPEGYIESYLMDLE